MDTQDLKTNIIGISGVKGSGKDTAANFILGTYMLYLNVVCKVQKDKDNKQTDDGGFSITDEGKLYITNLFGDTEYAGIFDYQRQSEQLDDFKREHLDKYIKLYSLAYLLKRHICMDVLGLSYEQCYGTNEQKNTLTELRWENMPGVATCSNDVRLSNGDKLDLINLTYIEAHEIDNHKAHNATTYGTSLYYHEPGYMTAREVLQYVGTELFRTMNPNVWTEAMIRQINKDKPVVAIIADVRFPNEVDAIHEQGGIVMRLNRNPYKDADIHSSEKLLLEDNYDWNNFDIIIDNKDASIKEQNILIYKALSEHGLMPDTLDI